MSLFNSDNTGDPTITANDSLHKLGEEEITFSRHITAEDFSVSGCLRAAGNASSNNTLQIGSNVCGLSASFTHVESCSVTTQDIHCCDDSRPLTIHCDLHVNGSITGDIVQPQPEAAAFISGEEYIYLNEFEKDYSVSSIKTALEGWASVNNFGSNAAQEKYIGKMESNSSYPLRSMVEDTWPLQWLKGGSSLIIPTLTPGDDSPLRFGPSCSGIVPYQLKREGWWNIYNRLFIDGGPQAGYAGYVYTPSGGDNTQLESWKTNYNQLITNLNFGGTDPVPSLNASSIPSPFAFPQDQDYNESWNWVAYISAYPGQGSTPVYIAYWAGATEFADDLNDQTLTGCPGQ